MSTLWVFGDSFGETCRWATEDLKQTQWHHLLVRETGMLLENRALSGTSLEWLYYRWSTSKPFIKSGDVIIATITNTGRRWLIEDHPEMSGPWSFDRGIFDDRLPREKLKAMSMYFHHLMHDKCVPVLLENWMYNLQAFSIEHGCPVLILPVAESSKKALTLIDRFQKIHIAQGWLSAPSTNEAVESLRSATVIQEGRFNHFSTPNHRVLCDKILSWIKEGHTVDLTYGFHENLIDKLVTEPSDIVPGLHKMSF